MWSFAIHRWYWLRNLRCSALADMTSLLESRAHNRRVHVLSRKALEYNTHNEEPPRRRVPVVSPDTENKDDDLSISQRQRSQQLRWQKVKAVRLSHKSNVIDDDLSSRSSPTIRTLSVPNEGQRSRRQVSQAQRRERELHTRIEHNILRQVSIPILCLLTSVLTTSSATSCSAEALQRPLTATRPGPDGRRLSFLWCTALGN